jgi:hypothetical protein
MASATEPTGDVDQGADPLKDTAALPDHVDHGQAISLLENVNLSLVLFFAVTFFLSSWELTAKQT